MNQSSPQPVLPEEIAQKFWNSLFTETKYEDLPQEVQDELHDYHSHIDMWSHLVWKYSGGKLSKLTYTQEVYETSFDEYIEECIQYRLEEELTRLEAEKVKAVEARDKKLNKLIMKADKLLQEYQLCEPTKGTNKWIEVTSTFNDLLDAISPEQKQGERSRTEIVKDGVEQTHTKYKKTFEYLGEQKLGGGT